MSARHLTEIKPSIRVAHHYRFPNERNGSESGRIGYCYAFHLVSGGKGTVTVPSGSFPVAKGDLLYFPPTMKHAFHSDALSPLSTYNIYCDLWQANPEAAQRHLVWKDADFDTSLLTVIVPNDELDSLPNLLHLQHQSPITDLFVRVVEKYQSDASYSGAIAKSLLHAWLLEIVQFNHHAPFVDFRIKPLLDAINKNAGSYEAWLQMSRLKKTQFHQLFKQATGMSPKAYWTSVIMKQAAAALRESNRSVTDIAEDFGYSSIHHFSKQFTLYFGIAPSQYRNRQRS
ncbi:AraC family transcriptional regulator [Paenibacillus sp. GCM10023248]|uniref:AraC family transcriptional regulator n=1 Tax=unclassified Paenibacillus TaxID=185978 RepID=UPI002379F5F2|nr:AraC family transcriptional regulator [Paenibacillus sp. MAHUQ-63]MDD9268919.1 AraC family transcriptional regulator [Paenibacillus sp. MAHUQ-63]